MQKVLAYLIYWLVCFFRWTYRFRYFGEENIELVRAKHPKGSYCLASWHEHALAGVVGQPYVPYCMIISKSKDGEFVHFICSRFGFETVRGSSSRGGQEARQGLEEAVGRGVPAAFTVDGPRGPRHRSKAGILKTAFNTGCAILPVAAVAQDSWVVTKAWDQTKIPKPFSPIVYQFGPIFEVPQDLNEANFEETLHALDERIKETEAMAELQLDRLSEGKKWKAIKKTFSQI